MQDALGSELFTILDMSDVALGTISVEEKGPATHVVSAVVEHLRAWGRKKVIFRIDGESAIRALGVAIQHDRSEETVIECRPKYSSPSIGPVEYMNKELSGHVSVFRIYLREKAKLEITTESPVLPWLVRHCGWISSRYAVRADGRTRYSRPNCFFSVLVCLLFFCFFFVFFCPFCPSFSSSKIGSKFHRPILLDLF